MTNVLNDEQKKISAEVGCALNHALEMAEKLPKSIQSIRTTAAIAAAAWAFDKAERAIVTELRITQQANGSWSFYESDAETETEERGNLTAAGVLDEITRIVMAASGQAEQPEKVFYTFSGDRITGAQLRAGFDKEHATDDDTQQATDAACVIGCDGPDNSEWRRVRAMELAISAHPNQHISIVLDAAAKIEKFLKEGGAQ